MMEMITIFAVILLMFVSAYVGVIKRGNDVSTFKKGAELQGAVDGMASVLSTVQVSQGARINATLPSVLESCAPSYTIYETLVIATCGSEAWSARYLAANITNGTAAPPFQVSGDVIFENRGGKVVVTP